MALKDDLATEVDSILRQEWNVREGQVVPKTADVLLGGGAVKLTATILYADLADSTDLAMNYDRRIAAKVFKSFLACSSKIIRAHDGEIRSFDGDRVMAVFVGSSKNTSAAKCALKINYAFLKVIKPKLEAKYEALRTGSYKLGHCVGVDTGDVLVIRSGIRNNNDLVWVGRAPNVAAKLSNLREAPYNSFMTDAVYSQLNEEAKYSSGEKKPMWEQRSWKGVVKTLYRSSWSWTP
jgi:adenylate cyclase